MAFFFKSHKPHHLIVIDFGIKPGVLIEILVVKMQNVMFFFLRRAEPWGVFVVVVVVGGVVEMVGNEGRLGFG